MCFSSASITGTKITQRCILTYILYILFCSVVSSKLQVHSQHLSLRRLTRPFHFHSFHYSVHQHLSFILHFHQCKACHEWTQIRCFQETDKHLQCASRGSHFYRWVCCWRSWGNRWLKNLRWCLYLTGTMSCWWLHPQGTEHVKIHTEWVVS